MSKQSRAGALALATVLGVVGVASGGTPARATTRAATCTASCDWIGYRAGPSHSSYTADAAISSADVAKLTSHWHFVPRPTPSPAIYSTPATWGNTIFVAGDDGVLSALDETTGAVKWQRDFGFDPQLTCGTGQGIVSSPAVRNDGTGKPLVYINGPDGYLYEVNGTTGAIVWRALVQAPSKTKNDSFLWSSPTLYKGRVYVGIASMCDIPTVRGGVKSYNWSTGAPLATLWTMPAGVIGAGVWASVAADVSGVYVATGSTPSSVQKAHPPTPTNNYDQYSIMHLDPVTLKVIRKFAAPTRPLGDRDFGASPVMFSATIHSHKVPMIGDCSKDGYFYAVRTDTMSLVWSRLVGEGLSDGTRACLSGGVWDGSELFVAADMTKINGVTVPGSVRKLDPATGAILWEIPLTANPLGAGSINGNKLLAYGGTDWQNRPGNGVFIIDVRLHKIIRVLPEAGNFPEFAQPIWAGIHLFTAKTDALFEWSG